MKRQKLQMIQKLVGHIEAQLAWGSGKDWSNKDFEALSELIFNTTKKRLSVTTLKRIWGRAEMISNPSLATLDILAEFIGYQNWRNFVNISRSKSGSTYENKRKKYVGLALVVIVLAMLTILTTLFWPKTNDAKAKPTTLVDTSAYAFTSRVVSTGMPNSVVFEYDASGASHTSHIEIQQDWDDSKRIRVGKNDSIATCIYYHPGFFKSKLVVNGAIVKENDVFIETEDWLGLIERDSTPIYLKADEIHQESQLAIDLETLSKYQIDPKIANVYTSLYYVKDFDEVYTNDFEVSMLVKNNAQEALGSCQEIEVYVLYDGGVIGIPLAKKGCISNLNLMAFDHYIDGKKNDLSTFGVDFDDFVELSCVSKRDGLKIYVDTKLAYEFPAADIGYSIKGISIHFKGTGSVKNVRLKNSEGVHYSLH